MRKAVWLLPADGAHVAFGACRAAAGFERTILRRAGIGPDRWSELRARILELCSTPRQAADVRAAIGANPEQVTAVMNVLTLEGDLLRTKAPTILSNAFAFVSTEAWLGRSLPQMGADEALGTLAAEYLRAYGPATADDFAWWTGLPRARCEQAMLQHDPVVLDDGLLLWPADRRAFEQSRPLANRVNLLPAWDPYPMGYADRSRMGEPAALEAVFEPNGASAPILLVEGRISGRWNMHVTRTNAITITIETFETPRGRLWEAIEAECGAIATLLQARELNVERSSVRLGAQAAAPRSVAKRATRRSRSAASSRRSRSAPSSDSARSTRLQRASRSARSKRSARSARSTGSGRSAGSAGSKRSTRSTDSADRRRSSSTGSRGSSASAGSRRFSRSAASTPAKQKTSSARARGSAKKRK
jgi:hypothetical protein